MVCFNSPLHWLVQCPSGFNKIKQNQKLFGQNKMETVEYLLKFERLISMQDRLESGVLKTITVQFYFLILIQNVVFS